VISGIEVMMERMTNPADASLRPVSSIKSSIETIVRWLTFARMARETTVIAPKIISSVIRNVPSDWRFNN